MRALLALVLYGMAALGGLAAGYFATAPMGGEGRTKAHAERRAPAAPAYADELAEMEAASRFLVEQERRVRAQAIPASGF